MKNAGLRMTEEEFDKLMDENPDIDVKDYNKEPEKEPEVLAPKEDWKHAIYMGLITGLLWAVTFGSGTGGVISLVRGFMNDSGFQIIGGVLLLAVGVAFGVCSKLFQDKVKYGEV